MTPDTDKTGVGASLQVAAAPNHDALREALARRDKAIEPCPYMKPFPPSSSKPCVECGADASEPCRKRVLADAGFVTSARERLPSLLDEIAALRERVGLYERALQAISSCNSHHPSDVVSLARAALTGAAS